MRAKPEISVVLPVLIGHDWQIPMTLCCIDTLFCTTDVPFELIIVDSSIGKHANLQWHKADHVIRRPAAGNSTADINAGLEVATAPYTLYMGNDIFVRDEWAEALLECFAIDDCGIATLASADLMNTPLANFFGKALILEGLYGPFMMFETGARFDDDFFPAAFADSDLMMRMYNAGKRSYRNCRVIIQHLNRQTINGPSHEAAFETAKQRFTAKHGGSPLLVYRLISEGWIT